jgi:hypothetical protein
VAGYHQGLHGERSIDPVVLPKAWDFRGIISLLAQEITPSNRTEVKPGHCPNLCADAFA